MTSQTFSKPKILVVDDEPDNLDLLYRTFYREYQVLRATSGPAALDILASVADIAVIISDQRMPQMSGTEFLSLTATQYPDIIRIILTGYTDVEDLVEAINSGKVFKYVTKPWEAEELKAVVRQALDTHNVLKARTQELCRTLRQESLLNTVTNTIRSRTDYRQILQTIVNTVGHMLEVDICILRPFQDNEMVNKWFVYQRPKAGSNREQEQETLFPILAQTVWETRDVQVIGDVATDECVQGETPEMQQRAIAYQTADIRSSLVVPLICQQELIAVMALHQCGQPRQWQDDEVQLVFMVADQAALALSQARAYERSLRMAKREALINTITTAIRSSLDPQQIFAAITSQLGQALHVDGCALSLWTESDEFVQCVGLYDKNIDGSVLSTEIETLTENSILKTQNPALLPHSQVPIAGNPVLQQLLITQQPVVINDLETTPQLKGFELPLRQSARALMVVPLISDGQIIGSISLREANQTRVWQQADIDLAQTVATQAAIAVQQSRLFQKTRQQAERLLELDRQKTEFFQNISHEFRTPLTLMMGPLESVVEKKQDLPHEQAVIALRSCRRLLRLVNQLLDIQRIDAGRMQASFRPCDLREMVNQIVEAFRPYCEKKKLRLVTELKPCPRLYLDTEKFDKVLYNLLSNAMKFTEAGGMIAVKVEPAGDHVRVQVKDTGIGIRTEQIPHLFERFRQAEGSVNRSYEGSGLGLALVKELVELHGGQISVESIYEAGTTFTVWLQTGTAHLPIDQVIEIPTQVQVSRAAVELADLELADAAVRVNGLQEAGSGEETDVTPDSPSPILNPLSPTILVVDDNPDLRAYVSRILQSFGFEVLTARDGAEGYSVAKQHHPQLIVTDLMMPVVSGLALIQMLREDETLKGTPIILLTAKVDEETRIEGTELGADAYLAKPFNDRELLAGVRNLLALKENERRVTELNTYLTESVLKRFLPPKMVQKAANGQLLLDLRPEPRLVTILFSDIVGFTQLSNTLRSRRVAELLNEYLEAMTKAVFDNGGTVDKFMGDAILALFGAPEDLTPNDQVRRAIAAARQMYRSLHELNQRWEEQGIPRVQFRCGIHQGTAVVGMFGSDQRSDYTAIGPTVNIASRLQEAAKPGGILVSAAVADYLNEDEITKNSSLQLKGVDETVLTFSVDSEPKS
jgi:signal transduction histidine kinase/class 3 adenylate cyclase